MTNTIALERVAHNPPVGAEVVSSQGGPPTFIDVFAGAGGLSLGLLRAGWRGLFAVEKDPNAFATLQRNLITTEGAVRFDWPAWLPVEPMDIECFVEKYGPRMQQQRGQVALLAGGPPCQGFSSAGRRRRDDPRNRLYKHYVELARMLRPTMLFFENVPGIAIEFDKAARRLWNPRRVGRPPKAHSQIIREALRDLGYITYEFNERAMDFGVPQRRLRYVMFGFLAEKAPFDGTELRERLHAARDALMSERNLPKDRPVSVAEAISDLLVRDHQLIPSEDSRGFRQIAYTGPRTHYQRLMREGMRDDSPPNSLRLPNHTSEIVKRFGRIHDECRPGIRLTTEDRERFGISKSSTTLMAGGEPAHTLTSLPDDMVHYAEPRVLTVREYARLQSFPDWYEFLGKYTTGGEKRRAECPRYTQVANAVPPLLAEVVGRLLLTLHPVCLTTQPGKSIESQSRAAPSA